MHSPRTVNAFSILVSMRKAVVHPTERDSSLDLLLPAGSVRLADLILKNVCCRQLLYGVTTMLLSELINSQWDDVIALCRHPTGLQPVPSLLQPGPRVTVHILAVTALAIIIIPSHMFWCLGNPTYCDGHLELVLSLPRHRQDCLLPPLNRANWKHRKQARAQRLPLGVKLKHFVQLQILCACKRTRASEHLTTRLWCARTDLFLFLLFLISMYSCSATLQASALARRPHAGPEIQGETTLPL